MYGSMFILLQAGVPGLDLSGSETMSTDSQVSACVTGKQFYIDHRNHPLIIM